MIELIRRLDSDVFDVHAVCFHRRGGWLPRAAEAARSVVEFPIHKFARPATWRQMIAFASWCRRTRIAIVQTCDFYANVFGMPAAALAGVPVRIASRRDVNPGRSGAQLALQRTAYAAAHRVVANSRAAAARLERERVAQRRIRIISNGIVVPPGAERVASPIRRVITVANLRAEKAHERLLAAAAKIAACQPAIEFDIVGDGPRRAELQNIAEHLGIAGRVRFLGHRDDVPELLAGADLFVLPSRSEAFPNGVLEAMASGLPVVACRVGGLLEMIDDGRTGVLVPPDDELALADAILTLIADPDRARALGKAARADVAARYSFDAMTGAFEQLYLSELTALSPAPGAAPLFS